MKKSILATFSLALMAGSAPSQAAESATINIKGSVIPTSCSVNVTGSADYGELHSTEVGKADEKGYALPAKQIPVNVSCGAPMLVALSFQADEVASTASTINLPVIGSINDASRNKVGVLGVNNGKPIGFYALRLSDTGTTNMPRGTVIYSLDSGATWDSGFTDQTLIALDSTMWVGNPNTPVPDYTTMLELSAAIDPKVSVSATDTIEFNTNTTVSLHYI
ncbi:hypothetical protein ACED16_19025 [Enterobacter hormaechei]